MAALNSNTKQNVFFLCGLCLKARCNRVKKEKHRHITQNRSVRFPFLIAVVAILKCSCYEPALRIKDHGEFLGETPSKGEGGGAAA